MRGREGWGDAKNSKSSWRALLVMRPAIFGSSRFFSLLSGNEVRAGAAGAARIEDVR
jgi:hypothetical protein